YISHKLNEVFDICDEITIFRDGKWVHSSPIDEITRDRVIEYMVGRELTDTYPTRIPMIGEKNFELKNLNRTNVFYDINFSSRKGEIVGIAGLVGAGRSELFRAVFGMDHIDSGEIWIENRLVSIKKVQDAIDSGLVMAPEDRKAEGLILCRSIRENAALETLKNYLRAGVIQPKQEIEATEGMLRRFHIKMSSSAALCESLSGGNQQKVVLAKWLLTQPKILILDEPTRGIDVGAKYEIYKFIDEIAAEGASVIMISSELPELIGVCDRIVVMSKGRFTGELERKDFSQEKIMSLAMEGH
ncbi:MAG: sugar ABC transporter ATP-binding protein, partial [Eubacteriales bacterium]|nr:sugar ABC transporter ATP-binding protein [Eubacteriales bacterium]